LGITTYFLLCGFLPFDDRFSDREIARKTMHEPVPYPDEIFKYISNEAKDFIDKTLKKNPFERPNIENVLEHKWFSKCSKSPIIRQLTKDKHICKFELYANDNNQI
jgi:serine/threonine protein kinase